MVPIFFIVSSRVDAPSPAAVYAALFELPITSRAAARPNVLSRPDAQSEDGGKKYGEFFA
jgi:hypothetical protein